jgi:AIPR protein/Domain of unknown function (DUF4357)
MDQLPLRLHQLFRALDLRFEPYVHKNGNPSKDALRSRSLTAMAIAKLTGFSPDEAGWRVTDAKFDDCIDGFAITNGGTGPPTLYLVQTKLALAGKTRLGWRDVSDLFEGFARLRHNQLHQNNRLQEHLPEIREALRTVGARCVLVWATSGELPSPEAERDAGDRRARLAAEGLRNVECRFLYLEDFLRELDQGLAPPGVTVSGEFLQDHRLDEQDKSLQGAISAAVLRQWYLKHDQGLFDENVRVGKESAVNREIAACLRDEPENFWYFHDGITALCEDWDRALEGQAWVPFTFRGLRIVNGAQTVTTIGGITGYDEQLAKAQVPIRFIKLSALPRRFGSRIAYATNRNNPMTPRELLALHHVQQRLRDEFILAWSLTYAIRAGDPLPAAEDGCPALEAVIAMAAGRLDYEVLVTAPDDIASLLPGDSKHHEALFNEDISVVEVWWRVRAFRQIRAALAAASATEREKTVAVLADLIIAHLVFSGMGDTGIGDIEQQTAWDARMPEVADRTRAALAALVARVEDRLAARPGSGTGFSRVSRLLGNQRWMAAQIPEILASLAVSTSDAAASPEQALADDEASVQVPASPPWAAAPEFWLTISDVGQASGRRCDGGFLVFTGSPASAKDWDSLTTTQRRLRNNLRDSLGLVPEGGHLRLTRDALFASPSQAADVLQGHSVNGPDEWFDGNGKSYNQVV